MGEIRFNSKLVRLKASSALAGRTLPRTFQFQTGAIKRKREPTKPRSGTAFQFQTGAIKSTHKANTRQAKKSFNSKLVRLKAWRRRLGACAFCPFQFQTGAIKSGRCVSVSFARRRCFNSKLVRLKGRPKPKRTTSPERVSIPNWCD